MINVASQLLLSIFPGIDMLGMAFEQAGFCIVRGPEKFLGSCIRNFHPPRGRFNGIIGGSPCGDYSKLNRAPTDYSQKMQDQYIRCVEEAQPDWFLYENVIHAPSFEIDGYNCQRFELDLAWFSDHSRRRMFIFGSKSGQLLNPITKVKQNVKGTAVTGSDQRSFESMCEIQGLPKGFELEHFSLSGKKQVVANGVPLQLGTYVAGLIKQTIYGGEAPELIKTEGRTCECGCGRVVTGRKKTASVACRQRVKRQRDAAASKSVTNRVNKL